MLEAFGLQHDHIPAEYGTHLLWFQLWESTLMIPKLSRRNLVDCKKKETYF